jgi:hypothetical protein
MAIVINGSGTVTGLAVGGLPDGTVDAGTLAANSVDSAELIDGAVDNSHLADNAVGLAEMASGTDGNIISYDASGNPVAIATGSDGQVLTSTGAGSPPAFETVAAVSGTILQTVYVENATDIAFPQNTSLNTTIVSAAITPTATSSKILVYWCYRGELNGGNYPAVHLSLNRGGSTSLQVINYVGYFGPTSTHRMLHTPGFCQDSPNTTSSVTYYLYGGNTTGSGFSGTYGGHANGNGNVSNILLVEVGA